MNLSGLPYLEQYFGIWCIEPDAFTAGFNHFRSLDLHLHMQSDAPQAAAGRASSGSSFDRLSASIAMIPLHGTLMKQASSMSSNTSTVQARRQLRAAAADDDISTIVLHMDSPGGTVAGTQLLADDIAAAAKVKPVIGYAEDLCASACYWLGAQCTAMYANATALVGSIGTFAAIYDRSGEAAMQGIKAYVVKAGQFKGVGVEGTEITAEHLAEMQRRVSALNEHFISGVMQGRKMTEKQARDLADGRVHLAEPAKALGLIDGVQSLDDTIRQYSKPTVKGKTMSTQIAPETVTDAPATPKADTPAPAPVAKTGAQPAGYADLVAACPGASADFICKQLAANATAEQATKAYMTEQATLLAAATERATKAEADAAAAKSAPAKPGVDPLRSSTKPGEKAVDGDPIATFNDKVDALVAQGKSRHLAWSHVAAKNPELREAMVEAHNALHPQNARNYPKA